MPSYFDINRSRQKAHYYYYHKIRFYGCKGQNNTENGTVKVELSTAKSDGI